MNEIRCLLAFGTTMTQKEHFQLHYTVERFMSGKHSSFPCARTFGIINKNAVIDYFLARILCNKNWSGPIDWGKNAAGFSYIDRYILKYRKR